MTVPNNHMNPEIQIAGYGSMNLDTLELALSKNFEELAARAKTAKSTRDWENVMTMLNNGVITAKLDALVSAYKDLEQTRRKGGLRSRGIDRDRTEYWGEEVEEGYSIMPSIDRERYTDIPDLEGPFQLRNGRVVYYDKTVGKYYDRDTDMYLSDDEYFAAHMDSDMRQHSMKEAADSMYSRLSQRVRKG